MTMVNWAEGFSYTKEAPPDERQETLAVDCPHCKSHVEAQIRQRFVTPQSEFIRLPTQHMQVYNFFLSCPKCAGAILVLWSYGKEPGHHGRATGEVTAGRK